MTRALAPTLAPRSGPLAALALAISVLSGAASAAETLPAFSEAGGPWVDERLPQAAPAGAMAEAWDNTLAGVYELALNNDPMLAMAEASYRVGLEQRKIARAALLPQANITYTESDAYSKSRGQFAIGTFIVENATNSGQDADGYTASLTQPLFDLNAWFTFRNGSELTKQAEATFKQAQQDLIVRVSQAYFTVLRAAANLSAAQAQEAALKAQLEQVQQRFDVGLVAITDVYDAQAAFDTAVADRLAFDAAKSVALEALSVLTGQNHAALWPLKDSFPVVDPTPEGVDAWLDFAHQYNVDLQVAELGKDAALAGARAAASAHLPRVSLAFQRSVNNSETDQYNLVDDRAVVVPRDTDQDSIALNVTMPLFAGGRLSAQRRQAYARFDAQAMNLEGTRRQVRQQTRAFYINVKRDVARTRARAQAIKSTQSALDAAQTGYEVGTRNVVDVLIAQRAVYSALRDHDNSIIDFVEDVIALKRQTGTLTPGDMLTLNQWLTAPDPALASTESTLGR